jgi:hypothetical protein
VGKPFRHASLVCLVYSVCLGCLVEDDQLDELNKPDEPEKQDRPDRPDEQDKLADFFSILLEAEPDAKQGIVGAKIQRELLPVVVG